MKDGIVRSIKVSDPLDDAVEEFWLKYRKKFLFAVVIFLFVMLVLNLWQPYIGNSARQDRSVPGSYQGMCHFLTFKLWQSEIIKTHYAISLSKKIYAMGNSKAKALKDSDCAWTAWSHLR